MKRVFAILLALLGGGITAYNVYATITNPNYFAGGYLVSSVIFTLIGLALLLIGIRWNVGLTKRPDAGDAALKNIGFELSVLGVLGAGIALTILLVSQKVFVRSAIIIGIVPIPGQVFYAIPIVISILIILYLFSNASHTRQTFRDYRGAASRLGFCVELEVALKKCLIVVVSFLFVFAFGCSTSAVNTVVSSGNVYATPVPVGGGSPANDWRNVTDGQWLYYMDYSESRLYRVNATLENTEMIYDGGYSNISLEGGEVWFWDWTDQLHHVSANGAEQVVFQSEQDITASWYYEGSLYLLEAPDYDVHLIKRLDLNTMDVVDLNRAIMDTHPSLLVSAGHIFFTEAIDEIGEQVGLYQIDLDGTNEKQISDNANIVQLFGDKLCYRNEDGLWAYNVVNGETERIRDDPGRPYSISDGMIYFNKTSGESAQLVYAPLYGGEETVLFPGHEASNLIVIWDGMIYFDEFKPNGDETTKYYIGSLAGNEAILWDSTIPSDYSGVNLLDDLLNNRDTLAEGTSWLYLEASATLSACYRLYDDNGKLVQQVLLSPNESKTISFPSGYYILKIAEGANWINDKEAFGPDGEYSSTSVYGFEAGSTYRIGSGNRGDFHGTDQSGF